MESEKTQIEWRRKAQRINTTIYVGLPIAWCEQNAVDRHTVIRIQLRQGGELVIMPDQEALND